MLSQAVNHIAPKDQLFCQLGLRRCLVLLEALRQSLKRHISSSGLFFICSSNSRVCGIFHSTDSSIENKFDCCNVNAMSNIYVMTRDTHAASREDAKLIGTAPARQ